MLYEIDHKIHIYWISKYAKISKNVQVNEQAKKKLKSIENHENDLMSFQYWNKKIEHDKYEKWNILSHKNSKKSKLYELHNSNS